MDSLAIPRSVIEAEEQETVTILRHEFGFETQHEDRMKLAAEAALSFLATKIVLPTICGLLSVHLYEKYFSKGRSVETNDEAEKVRKEIENHGRPDPPVVKSQTIMEDICHSLTKRNVDNETASRIAQAVIRRIKTRLNAQSTESEA